MKRALVHRLRPSASLPTQMTELAAGFDLAAALDEDLEIPPLGRALVPTGLAIALPAGFEGQVRPRSGLAIRHGVTVLNAPGTIDADYRGEIQVILANLGSEPFRVKTGDRVAQLVVAAVATLDWEEVDSLDTTDRGTGGFGHTG